MGTSDIVISAILLLLSLFFFTTTFRFPNLTVSLSPVVFPRFVTVCTFILSSILMVQAVRKRLTAPAKVKAKRAAPPDRSFILRFVLLAAAALIYIRVLEPIGFVLATPPCIAFAMLVFGDRKWYRILLVSIIATVVFYAVFRLIFRVPLPRSILW